MQASADDIVITTGGTTWEEIENSKEALSAVRSRAKKNAIPFNSTKSRAILLGEEYKKGPPIIKAGEKNVNIIKETTIPGIIVIKNYGSFHI
ncbi:hypothetical protein HPB48_018811 [Haemaphysalis longicornis]|uniref:Uncharacterized protein n=1 Tax=Haemaphysalis longicornis TaxID=44386 RepID=A0A9J6G193_HAELO|nr:hypothetical protein HPB48_018811 [Haemaphysalis longicornis]